MSLTIVFFEGDLTKFLTRKYVIDALITSANDSYDLTTDSPALQKLLRDQRKDLYDLAMAGMNAERVAKGASFIFTEELFVETNSEPKYLCFIPTDHRAGGTFNTDIPEARLYEKLEKDVLFKTFEEFDAYRNSLEDNIKSCLDKIADHGGRSVIIPMLGSSSPPGDAKLASRQVPRQIQRNCMSLGRIMRAVERHVDGRTSGPTLEIIGIIIYEKAISEIAGSTDFELNSANGSFLSKILSDVARTFFDFIDDKEKRSSYAEPEMIWGEAMPRPQ